MSENIPGLYDTTPPGRQPAGPRSAPRHPHAINPSLNKLPRAPGADQLPTIQCRVTHGVHEGCFPIAGKTVRAVKRSLTSVFGISYFAEARVACRPVGVAYVLMPGDSLLFAPRRGSKGGEDRPRAQTQAEALWDGYPELRQIKEQVVALGLNTEQTAELALGLAAEFFEKKFGPLTGEAVEMLAAMAERLTAAKVGAGGRGKRGRKTTTETLAHFAQILKVQGRTWAEIKDAWSQARPNSQVKSADHVRDAVRRYYRRKNKDRQKKNPSRN